MTLYIVYNPSGIVQRYCSRLPGYIIENNFSSIEAEDKLDRVVKSMAGGGEIKKKNQEEGKRWSDVYLYDCRGEEKMR